MIIRKNREQLAIEADLFGGAPEEGATTTEEMRETIREYRENLESSLEYAEKAHKACDDAQSTFDVIRIKEQLKIVAKVEADAERHEIAFMADEIKREYDVASRQNAACTSIYWIAATIVYRDLDKSICYIVIED